MKILSGIFLLIVVLLLVSGSPLSGKKPVRGYYYGSPELILPMSFAHQAHTTVNCLHCHHNYIDDTGMDMCMSCHVRNQEIWPLFEKQFHNLCRDCHAQKAAEGIKGGPPRECMACHLGDELP